MTDGPETLVGRKFRGFRCDAPVGEGPRAWVFQGRQIALDRPVALKILKPGASPEDRRVFLGAARAAAALVHARAVPIINVVEEEDMVAVVSEWVPSPPLSEIVANGPLAPEDVCRFAADVMDAIHALHLTNRCHGNLAPGNVFVDGDGRARVSDFFLPCPPPPARRGFRAPEAEGGRAPDWRSDLYALAGLACLAATGRSPVEGVPAVMDARTAWGRWLVDWRAADPTARAADPDEAAKRLAALKAATGEAQESRDARHYRRMPANMGVEFRTWSTTPERTARFFSRIRDIGENGVFIQTDHPMPVGTVVDLSLDLPGRRMTALGLVRWLSSPPAERGMGVQFVETTTEDREEFRTFLDGQTADKPRKAEAPFLRRTVARWLAGQWGNTVALAAATEALGTTEDELRAVLPEFERSGLVVVGETHLRVLRPATTEGVSS